MVVQDDELLQEAVEGELRPNEPGDADSDGGDLSDDVAVDALILDENDPAEEDNFADENDGEDFGEFSEEGGLEVLDLAADGDNTGDESGQTQEYTDGTYLTLDTPALKDFEWKQGEERPKTLFYFTPQETTWYNFYSSNLSSEWTQEGMKQQLAATIMPATDDPEGTHEWTNALNQDYPDNQAGNFSCQYYMEAGKTYRLITSPGFRGAGSYQVAIRKMRHIFLKPGSEGALGSVSWSDRFTEDRESRVNGTNTTAMDHEPKELFLNPAATVAKLMTPGNGMIPYMEDETRLFAGWAREDDPERQVLSPEEPLRDGTYVAVYKDFDQYTLGEVENITTQPGLRNGFRFTAQEETYAQVRIKLDSNWQHEYDDSNYTLYIVQRVYDSEKLYSRTTKTTEGKLELSWDLQLKEGYTVYIRLDTSFSETPRKLQFSIGPDTVITLDPKKGEIPFRINEHTAYTAGNRTATPQQLFFPPDQAITLSDLSDFTPTGDFSFAGWVCEQDDGTFALMDETTRLTQDTTLYATYQIAPPETMVQLTRGEAYTYKKSENAPVVLTYTPSEDGRYWCYSESGAGADPMVDVYDRFAEIAAHNDDDTTKIAHSPNFRVELDLKAGEPYYFKVQNYAGRTGLFKVYLTKIGQVKLCADGMPLFSKDGETADEITAEYTMDTGKLPWNMQGYKMADSLTVPADEDQEEANVRLLGWKDPSVQQDDSATTDESKLIQGYDLTGLNDLQGWDGKLHAAWKNQVKVLVHPDRDITMKDKESESVLTDETAILLDEGATIKDLTQRISMEVDKASRLLGWTDQPAMDEEGKPAEVRRLLSETTPLEQGKTYYALTKSLIRGELQTGEMADLYLEEDQTAYYTFTPQFAGYYQFFSAQCGDAHPQAEVYNSSGAYVNPISNNRNRGADGNNFGIILELYAGETYKLQIEPRYDDEELSCKVGVREAIILQFTTEQGRLSGGNLWSSGDQSRDVLLPEGTKLGEAVRWIDLYNVPKDKEFMGWAVQGDETQILPKNTALTLEMADNHVLTLKAQFKDVSMVNVGFVMLPGKGEDASQNPTQEPADPYILQVQLPQGKRLNLLSSELSWSAVWEYADEDDGFTPEVMTQALDILKNKSFLGWAKEGSDEIQASITASEGLTLVPFFQDMQQLSIDPSGGSISVDWYVDGLQTAKFQLPFLEGDTLEAFAEEYSLTVTPPEGKVFKGFASTTQPDRILDEKSLLTAEIGEIKAIYTDSEGEEEEPEKITITVDFGELTYQGEHTLTVETKPGQVSGVSLYDIDEALSTPEREFVGLRTANGALVMPWQTRGTQKPFLPVESTTLYPVWETYDQVVILYAQQDIEDGEQWLARGSALSTISALKKVQKNFEGVAFDHWEMKQFAGGDELEKALEQMTDTQADSTQEDAAEDGWTTLTSLDVILTGPIILRAVYTEDLARITLEAGEGNTFSNAAASKLYQVKKGSTFGELELPTLTPRDDANVFAGWVDDEGKAVTDETILAQDLTITAAYKRGRSITLEGNDGRIRLNGSQGYEESVTFSVPTGETIFLDDYIKDLEAPFGAGENMFFGDRVVAWTTIENDLSTAIPQDDLDGAYLVPGEENVTLHPIWAADTTEEALVNLIIDANGGRTVMTEREKESDDAAIQVGTTVLSMRLRKGSRVPQLLLDGSRDAYAKAGYVLDDITMDREGTTPAMGKVITEDTRLYMHWVKATQIILDANGGYFITEERDNCSRQDRMYLRGTAGMESVDNQADIPNIDDERIFAGWTLEPENADADVTGTDTVGTDRAGANAGGTNTNGTVDNADMPTVSLRFPEEGTLTYYAKWVVPNPVTVEVISSGLKPSMTLQDPMSQREYEDEVKHTLQLDSHQQLVAELYESEETYASVGKAVSQIPESPPILEGVYADEALTTRIPEGQSEYGTLAIVKNMLYFSPVKSTKLYLNWQTGIEARFKFADKGVTLTIAGITYDPEEMVQLQEGITIGDVKTGDVSDRKTFAGWALSENAKEVLPDDTPVQAVRYFAIYHTWDEGRVTTPATTTSKGVKTITCTHCGITRTEEVPVLIPAKDDQGGNGTSGNGGSSQNGSGKADGKGGNQNAAGKFLNLNADSIKLQRKQKTRKLRVSFAAGDSVVSWKSSNTKIFKVKGKADGTCTLTAGRKSGKAGLTVTLKSGLSRTISISVQKTKVKTTKLILNSAKTVVLKKGQKVNVLTDILPITSQDKVKFTSSKKRVAKVSKSGRITALRKGRAVITVKSGKKKVKVTVIVQ